MNIQEESNSVRSVAKILVVTPTLGKRTTLIDTMKSVSEYGGNQVKHVFVCPPESIARVRSMLGAVDVVSDEGGGNLYKAMNRVLLPRASQFEYVCYINDDDYWLSDFRSLIDCALATCTLDIVYGRTSFVNEEGERIAVSTSTGRYWSFPELAAEHVPAFTQQSALIGSPLFLRLHGFDENFRLVGDNDLWIRAIRAGAQCQFVDRICSAYRLHEGQLTVVAEGWSAERDLLFRKHGLKEGRLSGRLAVLRYRLENLPIYMRRIVECRSFKRATIRGNLRYKRD